MSEIVVNSKLITKSLVMIGSEEHILEYVICSNLTENNAALYGLTINHLYNEKASSESTTEFISYNEDVALEMISFLSSNFVFPCHLQDIVQDFKHSIYKSSKKLNIY